MALKMVFFPRSLRGRIGRAVRCPAKTSACLLALLLSCQIAQARDEEPQVAAETLLAGTALSLADDLPAIVSGEDVFAVSDPMRAFLETHVDADARSFVRLNQLIRAVITEGSFGVEYDEHTRTAAETFRTRRGNCMSFTNMFVVMARAVGMDARFQEVEIPPDWSFDRHSYVLNMHINISIELGVTGTHVVDFNIGDFKADYEMRTITDQRALAHFFNNLGVEYMQSGAMESAFLAFRKALADYDRRFAPAWANLGSLYRREALHSYAEGAFRQALDIDRTNYTAMSNLVALYELQGNQERAERYRKQVESYRRKNPYYRYHQARQAFGAQDYDRAISHLKYAANRCRENDRFRLLLGLIYLRKGDDRNARKWMARAEKLADDAEVQGRYSTKIDRLLSASRSR